MRMQSRTIHCCLASSFLLTSALVPSFRGGSLAAISTAFPAPTTALSPEILGKLLKLMAEKGGNWDVPGWIGKSMGFAVPGATWATRSISFSEKDGTAHAFVVSRGSEQDLVFTKAAALTSKIVYNYRVHRDGTLVAATVTTGDNDQYKTLEPAEAQKSVETELAIWSALAASMN